MEEKIKIYDDVANGNSHNIIQVIQDLKSFVQKGPTTLGTTTQMIYQGMIEYIDATIYRTNEITISNIEEALAEPTPEATVKYLQDWLKQYKERYEVIPRNQSTQEVEEDSEK